MSLSEVAASSWPVRVCSSRSIAFLTRKKPIRLSEVLAIMASVAAVQAELKYPTVAPSIT